MFYSAKIGKASKNGRTCSVRGINKKSPAILTDDRT